MTELLLQRGRGVQEERGWGVGALRGLGGGGVVISCRGRRVERADLLFQLQMATVLPARPSYLFSKTPRSLIAAPQPPPFSHPNPY